jgi:MoaA/NifB/PqqE/SkfB family radical SAM enzyme
MIGVFMERPPGIPFLINMGLLMTYRCQVACSHCLVSAGPHRKEEIALEEALDWVEQVAKYRNGHIWNLSLTGGEPFCCLEKLKKVVEFATELGLSVSVVSNAFWAENPREAILVLRELKGLKHIRFSYDAYHQRVIPFEKVRNAILAAQECGLPCSVGIVTEDENSPEHAAMLARLNEIISRENIEQRMTIPAGRAETEIDASRHLTSNTPCQLRCDWAGTPVILPNGQITACCGALLALRNHHPLILGNLRQASLCKILDRAETNYILHTLRLRGPNKLVSMIRQTELKSELPEKFIQNEICDPCYRIMSSPKLIEWLDQLAKQPEYQKTVAHGRAYHLKETEMLCYFLGWPKGLACVTPAPH